MTRLEKIVLEQKIRKGNMGVRKIDGPLSSRTAKYFTNVDDLVTSFYYVDKHGKGKKYTPLTSNELVQRWLPTLFELQKYNTKDYIVILDTNSQVTDKTESVWDVFVVNRNSISKIPDSDIKKLGNVGSAPLISLIEFQRLKKQNELVAAKEKADVEAAAAAAAEKKKPAIEKTKVVVQNVIKGTETIDPNNLGMGTPDAKAFQELLYQVGMKLHPSNDFHEIFAEYRTKGPDGSWGGVIGNITLSALHQLKDSDDKRLTVKWIAGDKARVIEELRKTLATVSESINYFKGTGMNIKLKDLINEYLIIEQATSAAPEAFGGATTTSTTKKKPTSTTKKKPSSTDFTPGKRKITYKNGNTFEGSWKHGEKSGPGIYKLKTGKTYTGEWSNGKKNGEFKITYPNDDTRVGTFSNSLLSGPVTFTPKDGEPVQEIWKDSKLLKSNATYWSIAKDWVVAEYNFWEGKGKGPKGQKRPVSHRDMFVQFNSTGFGNFIGQDDEDGAAKAYKANRKIALQWLDKELAGSVEVTGHDYYTKIKKWIDKIVDSIDDVFQNDCTVTLTNDAEGDTITRTVQGEIDVDW
tara:strand:- start:5600 stop:7333 length:1734 start_codon:yes stop_codon:yes gene_type:complete